MFKQVCMGIALGMSVAHSYANKGTVAGLTASLPDIGPPPQGEVQWIARSMRMNGVPMTLKSLRSHLSPTDLFSFYEARLRGEAGGEFRRWSTGEWQLLAIRSTRHYVTLQVRQVATGSEGTIAVTNVPSHTAANLTSEFPRPATTRILSLQEYDDAGIESEHISMSSSRAVAVEARAFRTELTRRGWQVVREQAARDASRSWIIEAQHGAEQASIALLPDRAQPAMTAIVVVWRKS